MRISQKCSVAIHCLIFLHERGDSVNVTSGMLSESTGCNAVIIRRILGRLKKAQIISAKSGVGNARLIKSPERITLYDIVNALDSNPFKNLIGIHTAPSMLCPIGSNIYDVLQMPYEKIRNDFKESLKSIRLDSIIKYYHEHIGREK